MKKNKIFGIIAIILGLIWTIGGGIGILNGIITGIRYNDLTSSMGIVMGAGLVFILGILVLKYGYKKLLSPFDKPE